MKVVECELKGTDGIVMRDDFVEYVRMLAVEAARKDCDWDNTSLSDYLEALAALVDDSRYAYYKKYAIEWRKFA